MAVYGSGVHDGVTNVDTDVLREVASFGEQKAARFLELLESMTVLMENSAWVWEGPAADLYRGTFKTEIHKFRDDFNAFKLYIRDLNEYADKYDGVIREAEIIANAIEIASWADV